MDSDFSKLVSVRAEMVDARELLWAHRKATITKIPKGIQKTFKQMVYSSKRPHSAISVNNSQRLRIGCKQRESILPCINSPVMVLGMFCWHTLGLSVSVEYCLKPQPAWTLLLTMLISLWRVYQSSDGCFKQDNVPFHKAQIISTWFLEHNNASIVLKWLL